MCREHLTVKLTLNGWVLRDSPCWEGRFRTIINRAGTIFATPGIGTCLSLLFYSSLWEPKSNAQTKERCNWHKQNAADCSSGLFRILFPRRRSCQEEEQRIWRKKTQKLRKTHCCAPQRPSVGILFENKKLHILWSFITQQEIIFQKQKK